MAATNGLSNSLSFVFSLVRDSIVSQKRLDTVDSNKRSCNALAVCVAWVTQVVLSFNLRPAEVHTDNVHLIPSFSCQRLLPVVYSPGLAGAGFHSRSSQQLKGAA